jgi:hypothetical protein
MLVHLLVTGGNQRAFRAQAHAADALHLVRFFQAAILDFSRERVLHTLALAGEAAGGHAHPDLVLDLLPRFAFGNGYLFQLFKIHGDSIC